MATPNDLDRGLLGEAGFALDDATYVQLVAVLGVEQFYQELGPGPRPLLTWRPRIFAYQRGDFTGAPDQRDRSLAAWRDWLTRTPTPRIVLHSAEFDDRAPDLAAIVRLLNRPEVGVRSVFAGRRMPEADVPWQWPLRLAAYPEEVLEAFRLTELHNAWPSSSLMDVRPLCRDNARCEVLVLRGSVRDGVWRTAAGYADWLAPSGRCGRSRLTELRFVPRCGGRMALV
jgi:hypothetical protein